MTILQYPGKKNSIAQWIIEHFPTYYQSMTYLEPFFGSGSVFFCKKRSKIETINDIDGEITNLFLQIRENPDELKRMILNTPWSREEYDLAFEKADNPTERARRCIVRYWYTIGANVRKKNGMRFEIKRHTGGLNTFHEKLPEAITQAAERLRHSKKSLVQIENRSVFELLPIYNRENVLIYLDPPYLLETRKNKKVYPHEFADDDHEELLKIITSLKAKIIISGYKNELYCRYLDGWKMEQTMAKDLAGNNKTETIWMNYRDCQGSLFAREAI